MNTRRAEVLVTGFEPFADYDINPSAGVAASLDGVEAYGARIHGVVLPVDLQAMPRLLCESIERCRPTLVVSTGLAAGLTAVAVERVAINMVDLSATPDNAGLRVVDASLVPDGPDALFSTAPARVIADRLRAEGIPVMMSYSAGTHLCNAALYHALWLASCRDDLDHRAIFLHLPLLPVQAARCRHVAPSMDAETMRRAVMIAVAASVG